MHYDVLYGTHKEPKVLVQIPHRTQATLQGQSVLRDLLQGSVRVQGWREFLAYNTA